MNPPKMPIHIGDLLRDTGHLRALLIGAYMLLLMHHWSTGSLPDDDDQLSAIARLTPPEWRKAKPILEKFFKPGWIHGRVEKELEAARENYQARAKAGSEGGKAKARLKQKASNATDENKQCSTNLEPRTKVPKEEKKETREVALDDGWPADYREQFWQGFPNKVGKPKALAKLDGCRKRGIHFSEIMTGLQRYIQTKPADRAWLNPETFLNQERWADQPAAVAQQGNSNGRRTVHDAARDLDERVRALDDLPPELELRDGAGTGVVRLLPAR